MVCPKCGSKPRSTTLERCTLTIYHRHDFMAFDNIEGYEVIIKRKFEHIVDNPRLPSIDRCDSCPILMMSGEPSERDQLWVTDDGLSSDGQQFHAYLRDLISVPFEKYCLSLIGQLHNVILLRIRELTVPSYIAEYVRNCKIVRITAKKSQWGRC